MVDHGSNSNKRIWKRFPLKGVATALMRKFRLIEVGPPKYVEFGPIVDISRGGLAVQYIANKKRDFETDQMAISVPESGIVVAQIPFKVVSDIEISRMPDGKVIRKKSVQFGELTSRQEFRLEAFIQGYARK